MDVNGGGFWMLAEADDFVVPATATWDQAARALVLRSQRQLAGFPSDRAAARTAADAVPPATSDAWRTWARCSGDRRTVLAGGGGAGTTTILDPASLGLAADEGIRDLAWGGDGVLYLALGAPTSARVVLVDRRGRWAPVSLPCSGFAPDRVAGDPRGGCWLLDRGGRRLGRVRGLPLPARGMVQRDPSLAVQLDEDPDPPRLTLSELVPAAGELIDLAVDGDGQPAVLLWPVDGDAQLQRGNDRELLPPVTLSGARAPFALAWAGDNHWLTLGVGLDEAIAFTLVDEPAMGASLAPDGDRWPLPGWDGGRFVRSANAPALIGSDDGGAWQPLAAHPLSRPGLADHALVSARRRFDCGTPGTVWHRLHLEAQLPAGCAISVHLAAGEDPGLPPAGSERVVFLGPRTAGATLPVGYLPIAVAAALRFVDPLAASAVLALARARLDALLARFAPGGPTGAGWPAGRALTEAELSAALAAVPGVAAVRGLRLFVRAGEGDWRQAPRDGAGRTRIELLPRQLPELAATQIEDALVVDEDGSRLPPAVDPVVHGTWIPAASEVPFHPGVLGCARVPGESGLFTALIQRRGRRVRALAGRYLWLTVELQGDGVRTPLLAALRVQAPRPSWRDRHLPELYRETLSGPDAEAPGPATGADFLERFLAIGEGLLTPIEDRIAATHLVSDPRGCPREALDWLGSWLGLTLEPGLPEERRRDCIRRGMRLYRRRGTLPGLLLALDLATGGEVTRGAIVVVEDFRLRRTFATILGVDFADEHDPLLQGLVSSGNSFVGDTLFVGQDAPNLQREFLALFQADQLGDAGQAAVRAFYDRLANRVTVLVHRDLDDDALRLVRRVVAHETPAHLATRVLSATRGLLVGLSSLVDVDTWLREPEPRSAVRADLTTVGVDGFVTDLPTLDPRLDP